MHDPRKMQLLDEALIRYERIVQSPCLHVLNQLPVSPVTCDTKCIRFIQIKQLTPTATPSQLSFVINALANLGTVIGYLVHVKSGQQCTYIGIKNIDCLEVTLAILEKGLIGVFPGSSLEVLSQEDSIQLLNCLFDPCYQQALATITVIPTTQATIPILNSFDALMGRMDEYVLFLLGDPTTYCRIKELLEELIELFSTLSGFSQEYHNFSKGLSRNGSVTVSRSRTDTEGHSCTKTENSSHSSNHARYTNVTPSTSIPITDTRSLGINVVCNKASGNSNTIGESCAKAENESCANARSTSNLSATNKTDNHAISFTIQNKSVLEILEVLNTLITRLTTLLGTTTYKFAAYLLSPYLQTAALGAYTYLGLAKNTELTALPQVVNLWTALSDGFSPILESLSCFKHPNFISECDPTCIHPTSFISDVEFASTLSSPTLLSTPSSETISLE